VQREASSWGRPAQLGARQLEAGGRAAGGEVSAAGCERGAALVLRRSPPFRPRSSPGGSRGLLVIEAANAPPPPPAPLPPPPGCQMN
jgi:hypothetical protein